MQARKRMHRHASHCAAHSGQSSGHSGSEATKARLGGTRLQVRSARRSASLSPNGYGFSGRVASGRAVSAWPQKDGRGRTGKKGNGLQSYELAAELQRTDQQE